MRSIEQPELTSICVLLFATVSGGQFATQLIAASDWVFDTPTATASKLDDSTADWEAIWQADRQTELENKVAHLESTLADSTKVQSQLLQLVEELARQQSDSPTSRAAERLANRASVTERVTPTGRRNQTGQRYRDLMFDNLLSAGFSAAQVEFILKHQKRLSRPITASTNSAFVDPLLALYEFFKTELSSDELNRYLEATNKRKVIRVVGIDSGSTAANIGLQPGDSILSVNGEPIFSPQYTLSQINTVPPGVVIPIEVRRPGSTISETLYIPGGKLGIEAQLQPWQ